MMKNMATGESVLNYVSNVPNMTKDQIGHDVGFGLEKTAEAVVLSKGAGMVTNALKGAGSTTLFRAGSAAELADVSQNGLRTAPISGYETGKLFATSASDAAQFRKNNFSLDGVPNTVMQVKIPNSVMKTATTFTADGMKAVSIPANQLPRITSVTPLNHSPLPLKDFSKFY
jgi:hypothetical protein